MVSKTQWRTGSSASLTQGLGASGASTLPMIMPTVSVTPSRTSLTLSVPGSSKSSTDNVFDYDRLLDLILLASLFQAFLLLLAVQCLGYLLSSAVGVQQTQSPLHRGV